LEIQQYLTRKIQKSAGMSYKIFCYRDRFENFKKIAAERTGNFPAKPTDDFARLVCVNSEGRVGFDKSEDASHLIGTMAIGNFWPWQDKMLCIGTPEGRYGRGYVFRPNSDAFECLVKEHEKYDLDTKKFLIMRRHGRLCPEPMPSLLSPFLTNSRRPIGRKLYKRFMEICHYVSMEPTSTERGDLRSFRRTWIFSLMSWDSCWANRVSLFLQTILSSLLKDYVEPPQRGLIYFWSDSALKHELKIRFY
jgi:hypothetical protein